MTAHSTAFLVRADAVCQPAAGLCSFFNGLGETVADWDWGVQKYLHRSTFLRWCLTIPARPKKAKPALSGTIDNINETASRALGAFLNLFPAAGRRCLHQPLTRGGPLLYAATRAVAKPDCVGRRKPVLVLADIAIRGGAPRAVFLKLPYVWNNGRSDAPACRFPLF